MGTDGQARQQFTVTRVRTVALAAAVVAATVGGTPQAAGAAPDLGETPPVSVGAVRTIEGGAVIVERAAGPAAGEPDGWRLNMDVFLENTGTEDLALEQVSVAYSGGSDPADLVADGADLDLVIPLDENDEDDPSDDEPAGMIQAGGARLALVPEDRISPFPVPEQVTVEFMFENFDDTVSVTRDLTEYVSPAPAGSLAFPFAAKDFADDEYVATGRNHVFASGHRLSRTQKFAYDLSVRQWNGEKWVTGQDLPDGQEEADPDDAADENHEQFIWGKPVYAMADGEIISCERGWADNPKPNQTHPDRQLPVGDPNRIPGGGNSFVIQHAPDEFTLYAHLRQGSVPAQLCPVNGDQAGAGVQVKSGQLLGLAGNSGASSGPHLHIHTQNGLGDPAHGRPLMFHNIRVLEAAAYNPDDEDPPPWNDVNGAAVTEGDFAGYGSVGTMLIDPQPRANLEVVKQDDGVAVAGTDLMYTITVINHGPEAAPQVTLVDHLPPEVSYVSDDGDCLVVGGQLQCALGDLDALGLDGEEDSTQFTVTVEVPHRLVFDNGGPVTITNTAATASAEHEDTPADNSIGKDTPVLAVADLALVSLEVMDAPPAQVLIGEDAEVGLRKTIRNHGPSWPMDVQIDTLAQPGGGLAVAPAGSGTVAEAVDLNEMRELDETYTITCQGPGVQAVTFTAGIEPDHPADTDPDLSNNTAEVTVNVECVVPVAINIRPGGSPNAAQVDRGTVTVAALTTEAGEYELPISFDAATIEALTARFGPGGVVWTDTGGAPERHGKGHVEDAYELDETTLDGDPDMVLHFKAAKTGLQETDNQACVKGEFSNGQGGVFTFFGCDAIHPVPASP